MRELGLVVLGGGDGVGLTRDEEDVEIRGQQLF